MNDDFHSYTVAFAAQAFHFTFIVPYSHDLFQMMDSVSISLPFPFIIISLGGTLHVTLHSFVPVDSVVGCIQQH